MLSDCIDRYSRNTGLSCNCPWTSYWPPWAH